MAHREHSKLALAALALAPVLPSLAQAAEETAAEATAAANTAPATASPAPTTASAEAATASPAPAAASAEPEEAAAAALLPSLWDLEVHGFASQGFIFTLGNDFLVRDSTKGSFEYSEVGLNVTKQLTDSLAFGAQLFAQDLGPLGNHEPRVDWFHLSWRWRDWLGLRVGRLKLPYGLYNEIHDIDSARVAILLPGSVYPHQGREVLFAHTGAELYGFARAGALGAFDYRLFAGTIYWDADTLVPPGAGLEIDFHVRYAAGLRLIWETPLEGLRVGGSVQVLRAEPTAFVPGIAPIEIINESARWVASAEYVRGDLVLTAEYSRWYADQRSNQPAISAPIRGTSERMYAMATYRVVPWFVPGAYYGLHFPDTDARRGTPNQQHDVALMLRFDVNEHWLVKLESHYMLGAAALTNPLVINPSDEPVERHWAAFLLKTTGYF